MIQTLPNNNQPQVTLSPASSISVTGVSDGRMAINDMNLEIEQESFIDGVPPTPSEMRWEIRRFMTAQKK